eukprot:TRINITY_DN20299_c0_g1_i1.p1 TRINITY_DN20299_c0_g1~~TRINITY_DN20299_c0_g1_i1.p1  ORF type:complete len:223 (+),score=55.70 TRINITY_DN20299_c0_g1_i1:95-670(+)
MGAYCAREADSGGAPPPAKQQPPGCRTPRNSPPAHRLRGVSWAPPPQQPAARPAAGPAPHLDSARSNPYEKQYDEGEYACSLKARSMDLFKTNSQGELVAPTRAPRPRDQDNGTAGRPPTQPQRGDFAGHGVSPAGLRAGQAVVAFWYGQWYPARVTCVHTDTTVDLHWEDGSASVRVPQNYCRPQGHRPA